MKAPSPPKPPDPLKVSAADQHGNTGTAIAQTALNNADVFTPFGSSTYKVTGQQITKDAEGKEIVVPTYTNTQTLSPDEQAKYDLENQLNLQMGGIAGDQLSRLEGALGQPLNMEGLPEERQLSGDYTDYRTRAETALRDRLMPELDRQREAEFNRLANQGVRQGSEAYQEGMALKDRQRNDAELAIIGQGGSEADRALQHDMSLLDASATARERALQERTLMRNQPLNEISSLMNGLQINAPQFTPYKGGTIKPTDISGNFAENFRQQMAVYQAKANNQSSLMSGLFGLGTSLIPLFSDRRLKTGIRLLDVHPKGIGIYAFRYVWDKPDVERVGYMADEVVQVAPEAVSFSDDGFAMVRYALV